MAGRPQQKDKSGKGWIGNLVFAAFIVAAIVALAVQFLKPTDNPILQLQATPGGAVKAYAKAAYGMKGSNPNFENMRLAVRKQDWDWFQDNYMRLYQDTAADKIVGITSAAAPDQSAYVARREIMERLASYGPSREDVEIKSEEVNGNEAVVVARMKEDYGGGWQYWDVKVRVQKEGKYWKVVDFAGGRASMENRTRPDDKVYVDADVAETESASSAPTQGGEVAAAGMPQPQFQPAGAFPGQPQPGFPGAPQANAGQPAQPGTAPNQMTPQQQLQYADQLLAQASQHWRTNRIQESLTAAQQALQIYQTHLGPQHQRVAQVKQMIAAAQQQLQTAGQQQ